VFHGEYWHPAVTQPHVVRIYADRRVDLHAALRKREKPGYTYTLRYTELPY